MFPACSPRADTPLPDEPASRLMESGRLEVDVFLELPVGIDREARARLREQRHVHHAVPDREDLVLADPPFRCELPDDLALPSRAHMDRHRTREDAVLVVEFV